MEEPSDEDSISEMECLRELLKASEEAEEALDSSSRGSPSVRSMSSDVKEAGADEVRRLAGVETALFPGVGVTNKPEDSRVVERKDSGLALSALARGGNQTDGCS
jgi:hypothetical protein